MFNNNRDVISNDPFTLKGLSKINALLNTHLSYTGSSVCKVSHKCRHEFWDEDVLAKDKGEIGNEFKYSHSDSPLAIFCHVTKCRKQTAIQ